MYYKYKVALLSLLSQLGAQQMLKLVARFITALLLGEAFMLSLDFTHYHSFHFEHVVGIAFQAFALLVGFALFGFYEIGRSADRNKL